MLRITYPTDRTSLHNDYVSIFGLTPEYNKQYLRFRDMLANPDAIPGSLSNLLTADFETLATSSFAIATISGAQKNWLKKFFNYTDYQNEIAKYFMSKRSHVALRTCYYCNIDFIYAFKDISDYHDGFDFIKRAPEHEIKKVFGVGDEYLARILAQRESCSSLDELKSLAQLNQSTIENLRTMSLKKEHSYFTLDHVLNKANHPLTALSLYNFVPSCYACNAKFKQSKPLITDAAKAFLSPTSNNFNLHDTVKFKIYFHINPKPELNITGIDEFVLDFDISENKEACNTLLEILKLKGRYTVHKSEIVSLIRKHKYYGETQVQEIAAIIGQPVATIKIDIFGEELFRGAIEDVPLTKLKRDIASSIGILPSF